MNPDQSTCNDPANEVWVDDPCEDVPNCSCGSAPMFLNLGTHRHPLKLIQCSNDHCEYRAEATTWVEAAQDWTNGVAIAKCERHSYMPAGLHSRDWRCCFCPLRITFADGGLHQVP